MQAIKVKAIVAGGDKKYPPTEITTATLTIQTPAKPTSKKNEINDANHIPATPAPLLDNAFGTGLSSLSNIRRQITLKNRAGEPELIPLTEEELHTCWGLFIEKLREKNNHSAVTIFKQATLKIIDGNTVGVITGGELNKKFIEVEKTPLVAHLQEYFNNRVLGYQVTIEEQQANDGPVEVILTKKQQYFKIIEEYPLVKELKDRLKLEIE